MQKMSSIAEKRLCPKVCCYLFSTIGGFLTNTSIITETIISYLHAKMKQKNGSLIIDRQG